MAKLYFQAYIATPDGYGHIQSDEIPVDEQEIKARGKEQVFREILHDFRLSFRNNRVYGKFTKDNRKVDHYPDSFPGITEAAKIRQKRTKKYKKKQYLFGTIEQRGRKRSGLFSIDIITRGEREFRVVRDKFGRFVKRP